MSTESDTPAAVGEITRDNGIVTVKLQKITEATENNYNERMDLIIEAAGLSVSLRLDDDDREQLVDLLEPS